MTLGNFVVLTEHAWMLSSISLASICKARHVHAACRHMTKVGFVALTEFLRSRFL